MEQNQTTYSKDFILLELRQIMGKTIPRTTFYRWLNNLAIKPGNAKKPKERYTEEERAEIKALCEHYLHKGRTDTFVEEYYRNEKGRDQSAA